MPTEEVVETEVEATEETVVDSTEPTQGDKNDTWTKEQVDSYTKMRIDKQNAKHAKETEALNQRLADSEAEKDEMQKELEELRHEKELASWREQAAKESGVPASVIRGNSLEEMQQHAALIKESVPMYPTLPNDNGTVTPEPISKEDILAIKDKKERVRAMGANPELFM